MSTPSEILPIVEHILNRVREEGCVPQQWRQTEDGQKVVQFILQVGKYNTAIGQGEGTSIGDVLDKALLEEIRDLLRSQLSPSQPEIAWQQVSRSLLNEQIQRLTTNPLTHAEGIAYRTEQVYVPLGLVERKRQSRRQGDVLPEQGSLLYEETEIIQKFEHKAFLEQVLRGGQSSRSGGRRIAIIGEPGAGKTTLLQQIARWVSENIDGAIVIWASLADLQGRSLESYLMEQWLSAVVQQIGQAEASAQLKDAFVNQFQQGRVWLLLDGIDEIQASAGNPLSEIERQIRLGGLLPKARIVLTCRLNLWDSDPHALDTFDTYRTLEFFYPDQVEQFIGQWFEALPEAQEDQAERLRTALRTPGKERIRDLARNPLRLTLLCFNWYLGEGTLPETKAGLYEQFVADFYEWKREQFPTTAEQQRQLNAALGELARETINKEETRFRLRHEVVSEFLGELNESNSLFWLALKLGWLNYVGVDIENRRQRIYAFFHPTFQEYFAALAINDWKFFLNRTSTNHIEQNYRVFEPRWREIILLWLGCSHKHTSIEKKEEFIKELTHFKDGCGDFYSYRAYFLAGLGVFEVQRFELQFEVMSQIIDWAFTDQTIEKVISSEAKVVLQQVSHVNLEKILLRKFNSPSQTYQVFDSTYQKIESQNNLSQNFSKNYRHRLSDEELEYVQNLPLHLVEASMVDELFEILSSDNFIRFLGKTPEIRFQKWKKLGFSAKVDFNDLNSMLDLALFICKNITNTKDMVLLSNAAMDLRLIIQNDSYSKVISTLKERLCEGNANIKEICSVILWHCANRISYLNFLEAWNTPP